MHEGDIINTLEARLKPRPDEDYYNYFNGLIYQIFLAKNKGKFDSLPEIIVEDRDDEMTKEKIRKANEVIGRINDAMEKYMKTKEKEIDTEEIFKLCDKALDILYGSNDDRKQKLREKFNQDRKLFNF